MTSYTPTFDVSVALNVDGIQHHYEFTARQNYYPEFFDLTGGTCLDCGIVLGAKELEALQDRAEVQQACAEAFEESERDRHTYAEIARRREQ
jgi:hypothetical protein